MEAERGQQQQQVVRMPLPTDEVLYLPPDTHAAMSDAGYVVVGGYALVDAATQQKRGLLSVLPLRWHSDARTHAAPTLSIEPTPLATYSMEQGGVFQLRTRDARSFYVALSSGAVLSMQLQPDTHQLLCIAQWHWTDSSAACTGLSSAHTTDVLAACYSDGALRLWDTTATNTATVAPLWAHEAAHAAEVWQVAFLNAHTLLSGGDDAALCLWDIRVASSRPLLRANRKHYAGGVTSLAPLNDTAFLAGSYDETLALWDPRQLSQPVVSSPRLGSGVWRLVDASPSPSSTEVTPAPSSSNDMNNTDNNRTFVAACMHAGWRVLDIWPSAGRIHVAFSYADETRHQLPSALAYGVCAVPPPSTPSFACASHGGWAVGCSFYDHQVSCWPFPYSSRLHSEPFPADPPRTK